jgi:hypothetical protein
MLATIPVPPVIPSNVPDYASGQTRHPGLLEKVSQVARVGRNSGSAAYCAECRIKPHARGWNTLVKLYPNNTHCHYPRSPATLSMVGNLAQSNG